MIKNLKVLLLVIGATCNYVVNAQLQQIQKNEIDCDWDNNIVLVNQMLKEEGRKSLKQTHSELILLKAKQFLLKAVHHNFTFDSAKVLISGLESSLEMNNSKIQSDVLQLAGQLAYFKAFESGNFLISRDYFQKALALREKVNDTRGMAESIFYIGLTYEQSELPDSAKIFYTKSYELARKNNLKVEQSYSARHLGSIAETSYDKATARKYYEESLQLRIKANYNEAIPYSYLSLADVIKNDSPNDAASLYEKALKAAQKYNITRGEVMALNALGDFYVTDCEKSVPYFTKAQELAISSKLSWDEENAKNGLSKCKK